MDTIIQPQHLKNAYTYSGFKHLVEQLLKESKATSGNDDKLVDYSKLNLQRMKRLEKQVELLPAIKKQLDALQQDWYWVVFGEGWCGDVAQNLPIIAKITNATSHISLQILLRDQHSHLMDHYLTNGGKAIPKLVCINQDNMKELGTWGPRPAPIQKEVMRIKGEKEAAQATKDEYVEELHKKIHKWYAQDQGKTIQKELASLIKQWRQS